MDGVRKPVTFRYGTTTTPNALINITSISEFKIGARQYPGSPVYTDGKIDQFQIYTRGLSPQEILNNYNAVKSRFGH